MRRLSALVLGPTLGLCLVACSPPGESIKAKGLVYCSEGSPEAFNPQVASSGTAFDTARALYNRLVEFTPDGKDLRPALAEGWEVSEDGLAWTFHLRRGVKFHQTPYFTPSREFSAEDVLFSFERQRRYEHPYHFVSGGSYPYFESTELGKLLAGIEAPDAHTVVFRLNRPYAPFLSILAMEFASILSAEYGQQRLAAGHPEALDRQPIGTGPYRFKRYEKDAFIRFTAHPDYWAGRERTEYLVFAITTDPSLRYARLNAGECDVMAYPLPSQVASMRQDPELTVASAPGLNIAFWGFNTRKKPFDNPKVRQALGMAVNREAIIEAVYRGAAVSAESPLPPTLWAYEPQLAKTEFNPDKARRMLKEAGIIELNLDIWAMPVQRPYNPNARKMAELIQEDLRAIGVRSRIISYEWGSFLQRLRRGEHDTVLLGWTADTNDPDHFLTPTLSCAAATSGSSRTFWCDPEFERLINMARRLNNQDERTVLYQRAQTVFKQQTPWLSIAHGANVQVARRDIQGLKQSPFGGVNFSGVWRAESKSEVAP
ncbi:MAG: ABC transporter substrate-binding protein [Gammaproteobacteria bacterium]|nr:ABC transporter substrate-binding protein [Gammaproteobacteria bacterium]